MTIIAAIETSRRRASSFSRSLFHDDRWSAAQVVRFVNEQRDATVASVGIGGQPHAAVVIAASVDDELYVTVHPASVVARNLAGNARVAASVCDRQHGVMGQGRAVRVGGVLDHGDLVDRLAAATTPGTFTPPGWDGDLYRIALAPLVASWTSGLAPA